MPNMARKEKKNLLEMSLDVLFTKTKFLLKTENGRFPGKGTKISRFHCLH